MVPNLDIDLLRTFIAIVDTGSFTRAAEEVGRTQSAVSMQVRRLEELAGRELFLRNGRQNRLSPDGERMLEFARRIVRLNNEAMAMFHQPDVAGLVRMGTPEDYADRFLPEILAGFAQSHPLVQVDVDCAGSVHLAERTRRGDLDLSLLTISGHVQADMIVRTERLVWVTSIRHSVHEREVLPVALAHSGCSWRATVLGTIESLGRPYRIAYSAANSGALTAAVISGLAVGAIPELCLRAGMRILTPEEGFPDLGTFDIGLARTPVPSSGAVDALATHIARSLSPAVRPALIAAE
ncbi:MAG: LysR family transcriptional regulator [Aestuariivirgaceae bacterium]